MRGFRSFLLVGLTATALLPAEPGFLEDYTRWRTARTARLAGPEGWLTLVGLHWLSEGENAVGSDPALPVALPAGKAPARVGVFLLEAGKVRVKADPAAGLRLEGRPVTEAELRTDQDGTPDVLRLDSLSLTIIRRGERSAVRVRDAENPLRKSFHEVPAFPPKAAYRVVATFTPYPAPKEVSIPTVLGTPTTMRAPGTAAFRLGGRTYTLEPVQEPGDTELFFIFHDRTAGKETYPAGRFLYADPPKDGKVVLDFNRAVNPPCAFTPFATCPLPPRQNWLPVRIPAGEQTFGRH